MKKLALLAVLALSVSAHAEEIGSVDTEFEFLGANSKVVVDVYDDAGVQGVSCFVSHAKTGGVKGSLGIAEDTSDASIACRQVGPISFPGKVPMKGEVLSERLSVLFKKLHVVRFVDRKRNTLVYLTYSDKLIDGSPKNSVSAVSVDRSLPIPVQ